MGAVGCTACQSAKPEEVNPKAKVKASSASPRPLIKKVFDGGQHRAALEVKSGGFALKNFAPTNNGKIEDCWQFAPSKGGQLGAGGFGSVRQAMDKRSGNVAAVKMIRKGGKKAADINRLLEEIEIMRLLDHPNIVRFKESFEDRRCIYIALEICQGGELFAQICKAKKFDEYVASTVFRQMLLAINYMHQNRIMHRDLKPENWLLATKEDVDVAPLKLIDFGISKRFSPGIWSKTQAGTPNYVAPEVLVGEYNEKCDLWSLGVILYIMLVGTFPFKGSKTSELLAKVKEGKVDFGPRWAKISPEGIDLVKGLLTKFMPNRPDAPTALMHTWLSEGMTRQLSEQAPTGSPTGSPRKDGSPRSAAAAKRRASKKVTISKLELGGLQAFGRMHQFKRAAITVVATQLNDAKIQSLKAMFMEIDKNMDGTVSMEELKKGLKKAGVNLPPDIMGLMEAADSDGSGVIDYTEFLAATLDKKVYIQEDVVWQAFKKFDLDGNGTIDRRELNQVLGDPSVSDIMHLKEEDRDRLECLFAQVDVNGDGLIDFDEFFGMMRQAENMAQKVTKFGTEQNREKTGKADIGLAGADAPAYDFISREKMKSETEEESPSKSFLQSASGLRKSTFFMAD